MWEAVQANLFCQDQKSVRDGQINVRKKWETEEKEAGLPLRSSIHATWFAVSATDCESQSMFSSFDLSCFAAWHLYVYLLPSRIDWTPDVREL